MCFAPQWRAIFGHLKYKKRFEADVFCAFSLPNSGVQFFAACYFLTSQVQKVLRSGHVLYILTCKCASRHSCVQFLRVRVSKNAPKVMCFVQFDFKIGFAPQQRSFFVHQNF